MSEIRELNLAANLTPGRKVEIKRRLADNSGDYETNWYDVTSLIISFGVMSISLDTDQVGVFVQNSMTLVADNSEKKWGEANRSTSLFAGFLTRYHTLFRVSTWLEAADGTAYPTTRTVFYGLLVGDIIETETTATLTINSTAKVFGNKTADALTLSASDTASAIVNKVLAIQDAGGTPVFDRYLEGTEVSTTTVAYPDVVGSSALQDQTCADVISRLCLAEDMAAFVGNDGKFYFRSKAPTGVEGDAIRGGVWGKTVFGSTYRETARGVVPHNRVGIFCTVALPVMWHFNGLGATDEYYGKNIIDVEQASNINTKIYNKVIIEHTDGSYVEASDGNWQQGDESSSDKYGEIPLNISEHWLGTAGAATLANALYQSYKAPKLEVIFTSSTYNPLLKLLDRVKFNYYGPPTVNTPGYFGISVFGTNYTDNNGVGLFAGRSGGIVVENLSMNIIGMEIDLDNFQPKFHLREAA